MASPRRPPIGPRNHEGWVPKGPNKLIAAPGGASSPSGPWTCLWWLPPGPSRADWIETPASIFGRRD